MKYVYALLALSLLLSLSGCADDPTQKEATAAQEQTSVTPQKQLEDDARSIEQAADEAVKLIEAEARVEANQAATAAKQAP